MCRMLTPCLSGLRLSVGSGPLPAARIDSGLAACRRFYYYYAFFFAVGTPHQSIDDPFPLAFAALQPLSKSISVV
jgi:hypothetical protein